MKKTTPVIIIKNGQIETKSNRNSIKPLQPDINEEESRFKKLILDFGIAVFC
jgi:hypothetical protein